ncbi:MAG: transcriptional repressor LexA [Eubacterium sp.]|nr:transcriptional repressor LexA [Eubacterium sp.]
MGDNREALSAKQKEILEYIKQTILTKGYPPSVREIGEEVNLSSTSSVHSQLNKLEEKGYIRRDPTKPRTLEILDDNSFNLSRREIINVPLVGQVAAGQPILAEENIENYIPVLPEYLPRGPVFMLRVKGDSMINAGIFDRDLLIVEETPVAKNGDIVVAMVDDSATVKTFYKEMNQIRLQPENDSMDPIIVPDCKILGRVAGVFRVLR